MGMIQKTTKIICDNCGHGIYDCGDVPIRECIRRIKDKKIAYVVYTNGGRREFCDEKCYEEWRNDATKS